MCLSFFEETASDIALDFHTAWNYTKLIANSTILLTSRDYKRLQSNQLNHTRNCNLYTHIDMGGRFLSHLFYWRRITILKLENFCKETTIGPKICGNTLIVCLYTGISNLAKVAIIHLRKKVIYCQKSNLRLGNCEKPEWTGSKPMSTIKDMHGVM